MCSVIIPTKNGGALFHTVLDALARQSIWNRTELIVVDSGSSDETVVLAKRIGARVYEIPSQEFNHGSARDYGIFQAKAENVILMVQDAVPLHANMLEVLLASMEGENVAGAYARQLPRGDACVLTKRNLNNWLTGRTEREERSIYNADWYKALTPIEKYYFCNFDNVCSGIKKTVWQQEPFGQVAFGEDIDWAERVLKRGYKVIFEPAAVVIHSHERPLSYEYKRTYVCHRKLYSMFGLRLVASLSGLCRSWIYSSIVDIDYVIKNEHRIIPKLQMVLKVPVINFFSALGQYLAVRDELRGISRNVRGV